MVNLSTVSSWKTTAWPSDVKETSNSTHLAPFLAHSRTASRLFSGASSPAARWAIRLTLCPEPGEEPVVDFLWTGDPSRFRGSLPRMDRADIGSGAGSLE